MKLARWQAALVAGGVLLCTAGWWVVQSEGAGQPGNRDRGSAGSPGAQPAPAGLPHATAQPADAAGRDPFLSAGLRHRIELVLLEAGTAESPAALKQRLAAIVTRHFAAADMTRATQLLERYVDYRVALGDLKPPRDRTDPSALRQTLEARRRLRERHFQADEAEALFGAEDELDRFTVAKLEVLRNDALTPAQKEAALRDAERELSDAERLARRLQVQHEAVAAQTAIFEAAGTSEHDRYQQRRAQYGEQAALLLAQLDREERDWQQRLSQYAAARASVGAAELEALRQRLFSPQEQLRIEPALALRELARK